MLYFFKSYSFFSIFFLVFLIFVLCFILRFNEYASIDNLDSSYTVSSSGFVWPTPNYTQITSPFGYRKSPFNGKTSYHSGIDIGAPQGSNVYSAFSGTVTYIGFSGANGFSIRISNNFFEATYSHLSPHFMVYLGQEILIGDLIAVVGPKNIYGVPNNPYKDSNGNPTNGSTTGPHLHFSLKEGRQIHQPPKLFLILFFDFIQSIFHHIIS